MALLFSATDPFLNLAGFILAVCTLQSLIGAAVKPLRILRIDYLPVNQHYAGGKKQTPAKEITDKQHGRKHHKMPPIINAAVHTTFILHNQRLERAKK